MRSFKPFHLMIECETTEYLFMFISQAVLSAESKHVLLYLSRL